MERLPRAAALVHPCVGLSIDLEVAAIETEHIEKASRGKRHLRHVADNGAAAGHARRACFLGRLDAKAVRFNLQAVA